MSMEPAICPRCSTPFQCGVNTGACWCADVKLNDTTRKAFAQYYDGCLCRDCLTSLENGRPAIPTVRQFLASQLKRRR